MFFEHYEKAKELFLHLESFEVNMLLLDLLKEGKINFITISNQYTNHLEEEGRKQRHVLSSLACHLGVRVMNTTNDDKAARKLIWLGKWCEGSPWGKKLDEEFGSSTEKS